jgi:hypothetical protein
MLRLLFLLDPLQEQEAQHKKAWEVDLKEKHRLAKMEGDRNTFESEVMQQRREQYAKEMEDYNEQVKEIKEARKAERDAKRREEWLRRLQTAEQRMKAAHRERQRQHEEEEREKRRREQEAAQQRQQEQQKQQQDQQAAVFRRRQVYAAVPQAEGFATWLELKWITCTGCASSPCSACCCSNRQRPRRSWRGFQRCATTVGSKQFCWSWTSC